MRRGWRQEDLARRAGQPRSLVGSVEHGTPGGVSLVAAAAIASALDATAVDRPVLRWQGEELDSLLDEAHARLVDEVVRRLTVLGWVVAVEVSFSRYGERGSIDVLAWHPECRALVVIEVKSVTPDTQAMLPGSTARRASGHPSRVSGAGPPTSRRGCW